MFEALSGMVRSKNGKQVAIVLGATVLTLTAIHYYNQIKFTRMKISELEKKIQKEEKVENQ